MRYLNNPCCYRLNNNHTGALEIQVFDTKSNLPISNAFISISQITYSGPFVEGAEGIVMAELYTNNNGILHIHLPALNELISGSNAYYAAVVTKDGYQDIYIFYIQIYPNTTSNYYIYLTPVSSDNIKRFKLTFQPTTRKVHEH